jgi:hypothetical protein
MEKLAIRFQDIVERNGLIIQKLADWNDTLTIPAIIALAQEDVRSRVMNKILHTLQNKPQKIALHGITFNKLSNNSKQAITQLIRYQDSTQLTRWYTQLVKQTAESYQTVKRIQQHNLDHMIEYWLERHQGTFPIPNWYAMTEMHTTFGTDIQPRAYDDLYMEMYNGLQTSTFEVYLEDTISVTSPNFH